MIKMLLKIVIINWLFLDVRNFLEVAVEYFLDEKIFFQEIFQEKGYFMRFINFIRNPHSLECGINNV